MDLAVEVVGRPEVVAEGLDMLCPSGTYLTMGLVTGGLIPHLDMEKVVHKALTIVGSGNYKPWVMPKVLDLLVRTRDKYPFDKLVSHKFKLGDINEGIQQSRAGRWSAQPRGDQRWSTFLRNHAKAILACDFFVAVTATFRMLYVFVVTEHGTRSLWHVNVTPNPTPSGFA